MRRIVSTIGISLAAVCCASGQSTNNVGASTAAAPLERGVPALREGAVEQVQDQTNSAIKSAEHADQIRNACIKGRRMICGRVVKILPEGLIVESGYTALTKSPLNQSWVVDSGASVTRDRKALEVNEPGAACVGVVFLIDFPKRPSVKLYDYVSIQGYPVGQKTYTSVPGVEKTVRRFSAGLETAIRMNLEAEQK